MIADLCTINKLKGEIKGAKEIIKECEKPKKIQKCILIAEPE